MNWFELERAQSFIHEGDDFLVVSHVQPDGDAISSLLATGLMLGHLGKTYTMAIGDRVPGKFGYLAGSDLIRRASQDEPPERQFSHIIALDCADFSRVGATAGWFKPDARLLNIDHHPTNDGYGDVRLIRPSASATAEILYDLANALGVPWSKSLADCIYTGILTDTGGFRYSNTTPESMRIASEMLKYGTDAHELAEWLLEKIAYPHILLLKRALATLSFDAGKRISWVVITMQDMAETMAKNEDLEGLVNYPRNIEGVEVGILFKEVDERKVKVSLRSAGGVDVAAFAKSFGGGGHVRAAGVTLAMPLSEAVETVVRALRELMA